MVNVFCSLPPGIIILIMIQEYLALIVFSSALILTLVSLIRFIMNFRKKSNSCHGDCSCDSKTIHKLQPDYLKNKKNSYKHVKLK